MTLAGMIAAIGCSLERRMSQAAAQGLERQSRGWASELRFLSSEPYARRLVEVGFDPSQLDSMALYVLQKVRRLVAASIGVGKPDPYTATIIANARGNQALTNRAMRASLGNGWQPADFKPVARRNGSDGTAQAQASSSRLALLALGIATTSGGGRFAAIEVDLNHVLLKELPA